MDLYEVVTAKLSDLEKEPVEDNENVKEVIPTRNRGRPKVEPLGKGRLEYDPDYVFTGSPLAKPSKDSDEYIADENNAEEEDAGDENYEGDESSGEYDKENERNIDLDEKKLGKMWIPQWKKLKREKGIIKGKKGEFQKFKEETRKLIEAEKREAIETYVPPDPQHNCMNFTRTPEQDKVLENLRRQCERIGPKFDLESIKVSLRWAINERLVYCPVHKAASTTWVMNYYKLSGSKLRTTWGNLHTRIRAMFPQPTNADVRKKIYDESVKFLIVRHPFERLVSAYRNKLYNPTGNPKYLELRKNIIDKYRTTDIEQDTPTFREMVAFILDQMPKLRRDNHDGENKKLPIDSHFLPLSRQCKPCTVNYDLVSKFETINEDSEYLINSCNLQDKLSIKRANPSDSISNKKEVTKYEIEKLYQYFRLDFELFDYSVQDYLNL